MNYAGDIRLEDTIDLKFTTRRFTTGAPFALASGVISAYIGNSTTQITAGITLTADFDTVTGLNNVRVVATAANGYTAATNVYLVITTGTVDSVSVVGEVVGSFSIENRSALMPTTVARKLDVSAGGEAGVDWANVGSPTTTLGLTNTTVGVVTLTNTATTLTNLPAITANWLTAAGTAADFGTELATAIWTDTTAGDFTVALSVGKSVMNGVALGTGLTVARCTLTDTLTTYTGNTVQTGDSFGRIGATGSGLTSLMASYTQPTGFLAATFPGGTVANTTNITAGTITTVTNLTNAPTSGDLTATMKTSVQTAADAAVTANASIAAIKAPVDDTIVRGTSSATASTTSLTPSAFSPAGVAADQFKGRVLVFDNDTTTTALRGQATTITASSAASLPVLTYTALTTSPASGDTFSLL